MASPSPIEATICGVLDPAVIEDLRRLGGSAGSLLNEMLAVFVIEGRQLLIDLEDAHCGARSEDLGDAAHRLIGVSCLVGASRLARECKVVERCARGTNDTDTQIELEAMRFEFAAAFSEVEALLRS